MESTTSSSPPEQTEEIRMVPVAKAARDAFAEYGKKYENTMAGKMLLLIVDIWDQNGESNV